MCGKISVTNCHHDYYMEHQNFIDVKLVQLKSEYIMSMFGLLDFCEAPDWSDFFHIFLSFADELRTKGLKGPVGTNNGTLDQFPDDRNTLFRPICVFFLF